MLYVERFKKEISDILKKSSCNCLINCKKCKNEKICEDIDRFNNDSYDIEKLLFSEYKEPINVTKFEYDLINVYYKNALPSNVNQKLRSYNVICKLKEKGYFKNLDLDMTIGEFKDRVDIKE